jgi:hypothetical protein
MKQKLTLIAFIAFASIVLSGYRNGAANNAGVDCTGSDGVTTGCRCERLPYQRQYLHHLAPLSEF